MFKSGVSSFRGAFFSLRAWLYTHVLVVSLFGSLIIFPSSPFPEDPRSLLSQEPQPYLLTSQSIFSFTYRDVKIQAPTVFTILRSRIRKGSLALNSIIRQQRHIEASRWITKRLSIEQFSSNYSSCPPNNAQLFNTLALITRTKSPDLLSKQAKLYIKKALISSLWVKRKAENTWNSFRFPQ